MPPTTPEIAPIEPQPPSLARRFAWSLRFQTVVLSGLLAISAVVFTLEVARFGPESDRTREALREVRRVHMAMLDQETGIRGYLLTHDRRFLEPHTAGTQRMTSSNTRLSVLLAGDRVCEVAVPLIVGARVVGVVQLSGGTGARTPDTLEMLEILASHAASAIESARLHQSTEEHSQRDALTRLYSRRRLNHDLDEEVRRCRRYHRPLSFIMLDVDHFKRLNDTHGHAKGDDILQELGRVLEEAVRDTDTPYRYGGEEFCVLVRETNLDGARELAERLRARIADHFAHANGEPPVTASLGVATLSERMAGAAEMVQAADRSLYEAKRAGRNRVVVTTPARPEAVS